MLFHWFYVVDLIAFNLFSAFVAAVPSLSQESILIEDLLSCLHGFHGKYIIAEPLSRPFDPRTFLISDSVGKYLCF